MVSADLQQFVDFAAFSSVPASSRKFRPLATNQKAGVRISQGAPLLLESDSCSEMNIWCFSSFSFSSVQ